MRIFVCGECGKRYPLSDVNLCPFCKMDLTNYSDLMVRNHCRKCALSLAPRQYSERKRGRPSHKEVAEQICGFNRHCRNCGTHCAGCEEGYCDRWTAQKLGRCPFCGRIPIMVSKEGTHAIICDDCGVKMFDTDELTLVDRWNRTNIK